MYEPIRTKSVHTMAEDGRAYPHHSREEELDIQLAGHLAALLAVTDELGLTAEGDRIAAQVARLRSSAPIRHTGPADADPANAYPAHADALHQRALALAGRALVVAASRADTSAAILAAQRIDAHTAARHLTGAH